MEKKFSPSVRMKIYSNPEPSVIKILSDTIWGTPGGTLYKHHGTEKTIFNIVSPQFYSLERHETILCTVCLAKRKVNLGNEMISSDYVRYLAANPGIIRKKKRYKQNGFMHTKGAIKQFMNEVFEVHPLKISQTDGKKSMHYAFVETENEQSMHFCKYFDFKQARKMDTITFSRLNPKAKSFVRKADKTEFTKLETLVAKQYSDYNLYNPQHLFYEGNFYVVEIDGEIVAGLQSNPMSWAFTNLPGISGKIILKVLPHIPYIKRLINPKDFQFSAFEGIFCKTGYEYVLNDLFESVIALQNNYKALIWLDSKSPMTKSIRKNCKLGIIDKINDNGSGEVMIRGNNLSDDNWLSLKANPIYVSSFDFN